MRDQINSQDKRSLLEKLLREQAVKNIDRYPLSEGQKSLWVLHQMAPESSAYTIGFTARISSEINPVSLQRALQSLLARHPALRACYRADGDEIIQEISGLESVSFQQIDASEWDSDQLDQQVVAAYQKPFNLQHGPLFRAVLFSASSHQHILQLALHHIAGDAWSLWLLLDELRALYVAEQHGTAATLTPLSYSYADHVKQESKFLHSAGSEKCRQYWARQLNHPAVLDLPADRPRPAMQTFNGASQTFTLEQELSEGVKQLARSQGMTVFVVLISAFQALLSRYSGQDDIIVGTPVSGRDNPDVAGVVGYFVNMLALRSDFSADPSFAELLRQVRRTLLDGIEQQQYPFPLLVDLLQLKRDPSRSPIFQVSFVLQNPQQSREVVELLTGHGSWDWEELLLEPYLLPQQEGPFDLTLEMVESGGTLAGILKYNRDLFDATRIARMAEHFRELLKGIVTSPEQRISALPLLPESERHRLLVEWNATQAEFTRDICIHQLFEQQAAQHSQAVAVACEERQLGYAELNIQANKLAHYLRKQGVTPDAPVAICVERSLEMVVGLLAILKASGGYLPLDPSYPCERIGYMLEDCAPRIILTHGMVADSVRSCLTAVMGCDTQLINLNADA